MVHSIPKASCSSSPYHTVLPASRSNHSVTLSPFQAWSPVPESKSAYFIIGGPHQLQASSLCTSSRCPHKRCLPKKPINQPQRTNQKLISQRDLGQTFNKSHYSEVCPRILPLKYGLLKMSSSEVTRRKSGRVFVQVFKILHMVISGI